MTRYVRGVSLVTIRLGRLGRPLTDEWLDKNASEAFDREWWFLSSSGKHKLIIKKTLSSLQGTYELELRDGTYMYYSPEVWSPSIEAVLDLCRIFNLRSNNGS